MRITIDRMASAYLDAVDFTDGDSVYSDDVIGFADEMFDQAQQACDEFRALVADAELDVSALTDDQMGVDLWLTRNGHGAGFWDRGLGELGDKLTDLAHSMGGHESYEGDDHMIYFA